MCVYMYVCMYACICVCVGMYVCIHIYVCTYVCVYVCIYVYIYAGTVGCIRCARNQEITLSRIEVVFSTTLSLNEVHSE